MPSFMDYYRHDIDTVLMDKTEKAVELSINGKSMTVFKDDDKLAEMKNQSQYADAIYGAELLLSIRSDELGYVPAQASDMVVDGRQYQVVLVSGEYLLQIVLRAVE